MPFTPKRTSNLLNCTMQKDIFGLILSFVSVAALLVALVTNVLFFEFTFAQTIGKFTCNIISSSVILSCSRCCGLVTVLTALLIIYVKTNHEYDDCCKIFILSKMKFLKHNYRKLIFNSFWHPFSIAANCVTTGVCQ